MGSKLGGGGTTFCARPRSINQSLRSAKLDYLFLVIS